MSSVDHQAVREQQLIERYLLEELSDELAEEFERHFFDCAICAAELRESSRLVADLSAVLREDNTVEELNIGESDLVVMLTLPLEGASAMRRIGCEYIAVGSDPVSVLASTADGRLRIVLRAEFLTAGPGVLVVRDQDSGEELHRRRLLISRGID